MIFESFVMWKNYKMVFKICRNILEKMLEIMKRNSDIEFLIYIFYEKSDYSFDISVYAKNAATQMHIIVSPNNYM